MSHDQSLKECLHCRAVLEPHLFPKNKRKRDGLDIYCKTCTASKQRNKYADDKEWRQAKIAATRAYHLANSDWSKERLRAHHEKHKEERYARHRERLLDPARAEAARDASRRSEARRRAVKAGNKAEVVTREELSLLLSAMGSLCQICDRVFDGGDVVLHWDHIRPLAKGGAHELDNLQPLCSLCNIRKNSVYPLTPDREQAIRTEVLEMTGGEVIASCL